jgi:uncharacterized membrane protein YidH (DUF202 family)
MAWLEFILFLIITALLIFSAIYSVKAAAELAKFDLKSNTDLENAHKWLTYASIVGWIGVGLIIFAIFISIYTLSSHNKFLSFFSLAVVIALGVLAALGWTNINKAGDDVKDIPIIKTALNDTIVATLAAIIGGVVLFGTFIYLSYRSS